MYTLNHIDRYRFRPSASQSEVYVLAIDRIATDGIVSISSDQQLSLFRPSAGLTAGPTASWATGHGNLTSLGVFDWQSGLVCTAGEDGSVGVWDLRIAGDGGKVAQFKASEAPILSMACSGSTQTIAVGTELQNHTASIHLWDVRSNPSPKATYQEVHSDDITTLSFHPGTPDLLLSGSTDGLVSVHDTRIADEDDLTVQTFNHNASIHHAGFLTNTEVVALSHDEQFALYDMDEERPGGDATQNFGDMRTVLDCQYVADVTPKLDGSGAVIGAGSQDRQTFELTFMARTPQNGWVLNREDSVSMPGAHGEEIVRSFCFFDEEKLVFTAGEDGHVRAWRS
ncbi:guanine nucleotide-binding protein beta subunit-like protein [Sarocladium implicatum]|nr:guanine nucleotide-binding protein beta subunit-like protein [Sarocladium implicatum]